MAMLKIRVLTVHAWCAAIKYPKWQIDIAAKLSTAFYAMTMPKVWFLTTEKTRWYWSRKRIPQVNKKEFWVASIIRKPSIRCSHWATFTSLKSNSNSLSLSRSRWMNSSTPFRTPTRVKYLNYLKYQFRVGSCFGCCFFLSSATTANFQLWPRAAATNAMRCSARTATRIF